MHLGLKTLTLTTKMSLCYILLILMLFMNHFAMYGHKDKADDVANLAAAKRIYEENECSALRKCTHSQAICI